MTITHSPESNQANSEEAVVSPMLVMLANQDILNSKLSEVWREQEYPFLDAIMTEATELFDHTEWKWWKQTGPVNTNQIKLEIVDIWHFVLSIILSSHDANEMVDVSEQAKELMLKSIDSIDGKLYEAWDIPCIRDFCRSMIVFSADPISSPLYNQEIPLWAPLTYLTGTLVGLAGMSYETFCKLYLAKSVLNDIRWEKGYGGTYQKMWFGREDNEHMMDVFDETPFDSADTYKDSLKKVLLEKYAQVEMGITG